MDELSLQRSPLVAGDVSLAAARIVQPPRQVDERQIGRPAVLGALVAEKRRLLRVTLWTNLTDHGSRCPLTLGARHGNRAVRQESQPVRIAETGRENLGLPAIVGDSHQTLIAGGDVKSAGVVALQTADEIVPGR